MQLLIRGATDGTTCVQVQCNGDVLEVKERIQERTGIPVDYQGLVYSGRQLQDDSSLEAYHIQSGSTLQLVYRLLGGKGGFGALLRGQGRDGKITENFDACRDLSGRRLRHQSAQQKLEQWKEEAKQRELEKIAMQHIKAEARRAKQEEAEQVDVHAIMEAQEEAITRTQQAVQDALRASASAVPKSKAAAAAGTEGHAAAGPSGTAGPKAGGNSDSDSPNSSGSTPTTEVVGGAKRKEAGSGQSAPAAKKPKMLAMLEAVSDSSDEDDE